MSKLGSVLNALVRQKDLMLIVVFVTILLMMILPLPSALMDIMITLNISAAVMIMLMSLQLHNPVHFSTFPSLLLVTTLFRLAISISTTRLILIEGDAGKIVETFGNVVVGGNLIVGLVIFLIITVVQFLVITKGADRVAEVGARFTLDGMPGKQMSVDADVRAGSLDQLDAKEARQLLEREAKLFGAMDGAMKFVKGDAMAGLVITAINLLGGVAIGVAQLGYSFSDALSLYAILTIGDGLVAQIPALLISVSAGTIVTRVTNPKGIDLSSEIAEQVTANHRTLMIAGIVIAGFGFIPGFPTLIFLMVGLSMSIGIYWHNRKKLENDERGLQDWQSMIQYNDDFCAEAQQRTGQPPTITLELPSCVLSEDPGRFFLLFEEVNSNMGTAFGVPMGNWKFSVNTASENQFKVILREDELSVGRVRPDCVFVKSNASYLDALGIPCVQHFGVHEGVLVSEAHIPLLQKERIGYWDPIDLIVMEMTRFISNNLDLFLGFEATSNLLDDVGKGNPALIADLKENLSTNQVSAVLKLLVQERIPMTSRMRIFEAILDWAPKRPDPMQVLQQVRIAISDFITNRFAPDGFLPAVVVAPTLESYIRDGFRNANDQSYLIIDSQISKLIVDQVKQLTKENFKRGSDPVILTQQDIRRALHNVLNEQGLYIPILAYQEVTPKTIVYPVGFISPENGAQEAA